MRSLGGSIAIALLALAFCACAATAPSPPPPPAEVSVPGQSAAVGRLTEKIAHRDRALDSLQTEAVMEYSAPDHHPPKVREQVTIKRPDSLRVEAMSAFSVALILVTTGKDLTIFEPSENKLIHAPATARTLNQFIQIPMAPADAVTLLLGIAPDSATLAARTPDAIAQEDGMTVASWHLGKSVHELGFEDEQLAMVRMRDDTGAVEYEVRYRDYHDIGGLMFPYSIEAVFPLAQSRLALSYKRPIVNGDLPASAFVLSPPSAVENANQVNAGS